MTTLTTARLAYAAAAAPSGLRARLARTRSSGGARPGAGRRRPARRLACSAGAGAREPGRPAMLELVRPEAFFEPARRTTPRSASARATWPATGAPADGTDLADVLLPFAERMTTAVPPALRAAAPGRRPADPARRSATRSTGSRRNIEAHYDLSNDLFAAFLDETHELQLGALRRRPALVHEQDLEEAQLRKVHAILDLARGRRRHPRARDRHRLGHARHRGGPAGRPTSPR